MKNYYKILRVDRDASADEIKKAYKHLVGEHHPAYNGGDRYATERFIDISVAYNTLINTDKRKDYNRILDSVLPSYTPPEIVHSRDDHIAEKPLLPHVRKTINYSLGIAVSIAMAASVLGGVYTYSNLPLQNKHIGIGKAKEDLPKKSIMPVTKAITISSPIVPAKQNSTASAFKKENVSKGVATLRRTPKANKAQVKEPNESPEITVSTFSGYEPALGDTKNTILQSYGTPNSIVRFVNGGETWYYANATFNFRNEILVSHNK